MADTEQNLPKPRWGWLYTAVSLLIGLLGVIEHAVPPGAARQILEVAATLALFGAMALWVRLNRLGLMLASERHVAPVPPLRPISVSRPPAVSTAMSSVRDDRLREGRR